MADYRIKRGKNGFTILKDGKVWAVAIPTRILAQQAVEEEQKHEALIRIATDDVRTLRNSLEIDSELTHAEVREIFEKVLEEKI
jgi:hypothetical protein